MAFPEKSEARTLVKTKKLGRVKGPSQARLSRKKNTIPNIRNKRGTITTFPIDIRKVNKNTINNLNQLDAFFEKYKFLRLTQDKIEKDK